MELAKKIEELRKEKKISVTEMASKIGMTNQGYYKAIKYDDFRVSQLQSIANALDVGLDDLLGNSVDRMITDFFATGLTDYNKNTENNPIYPVLYNYIKHNYHKYLFSFLDRMKHIDSKRPNIHFICECSRIYKKDEEIIELIKSIYSKYPNKEDFKIQFEQYNDHYTDMTYNELIILYLLGKGFFDASLLSKTLRKILINVSDFC